jgi:uncharacterized protein YkwD
MSSFINVDLICFAHTPALLSLNPNFPQTINRPISTMDKDQTAALAIHNSARARKSLQPLHWDGDLARAATRYAQHLAKIGKMEHASGTGQGENLFWRSPANDTAHASAAQAWINEASNYHDEQIPRGNFSAYGHYCEFGVWDLRG